MRTIHCPFLLHPVDRKYTGQFFVSEHTSPVPRRIVSLLEYQYRLSEVQVKVVVVGGWECGGGDTKVDAICTQPTDHIVVINARVSLVLLILIWRQLHVDVAVYVVCVLR